MNSLVRFLMFYALCATLTTGQDDNDAATTETARGLANSYGLDAKQINTAPAKKNAHIFMGIYKKYKSTYLGNKTTSEYKTRLRDRVFVAPMTNKEEEEQLVVTDIVERTTQPEPDVLDQQLRNEANAAILLGAETEMQTDLPPSEENQTISIKKRRKRKRKHSNRNRIDTESATAQSIPAEKLQQEDIKQYNVGPGLNVSLDMSNDIAHVKLDGETLKDIISARWLNTDNTEEGRGKKYDMITKVLPLFIIPFLIQSAVVPFLVTKLKLLLVKSILVGKLAIFLLIISAIKNSNKMQSYEVAPSYWASEPSRRSELAAAASSAAYNGYRVEGKPTTWIN